MLAILLLVTVIAASQYHSPPAPVEANNIRQDEDDRTFSMEDYTNGIHAKMVQNDNSRQEKEVDENDAILKKYKIP